MFKKMSRHPFATPAQKESLRQTQSHIKQSRGAAQELSFFMPLS
jgi:hypothetical protein